MAALRRDASLSAIAAGFLAVLISYAGPLVIVFQAAQAAQVSPEMTASWVWAISVGAGLSGIVLSLWLKAPVITAWSAPGTALLITLFPGLSLNEAVGAYLTAAVLIGLIGFTGSLDRLMRHLPPAIASGMLAGILFQFGARAFKAVEAAPLLGLGMLAGYLVFKRLWPRYHVVAVLVLGLVLTAALGQWPERALTWQLAAPKFISPAWSWASALSLALPLVLVSLSGQFLPGMAILRSAGYTTPARPILAVTSLGALLTAPFGGVTTVLAAITAALCTGREAHADPSRRYVAGVANGVFYLLAGSLGGSLIALFLALPPALVAVLAGLALLGAIGANLTALVQDAAHREAGLITFLATASGLNFLGLASAFWGVVFGGAAYVLLRPSRA
ncbi:benzoate/H(+) symporter BenE family transporter [Roseateles sp. LKC17W]|uniref:Benzoate/H(+) symporter BenE family transporter n=1 Tax=Pelomonas margarita TaxID=3299031 RepID=A0ABW7FKY0_9BURK